MVEFLVECYRPSTLSTLAFHERWDYIASDAAMKLFYEKQLPGWCVRLTRLEVA